MRTTTTTTTTTEAAASALVQKLSPESKWRAHFSPPAAGHFFFFGHTHSQRRPFFGGLFRDLRRFDFHPDGGKRFVGLLAFERYVASRARTTSKRSTMVTKFPPSGCFSFSCGKGKAGCVRVRMKWQTVRANLRINLRSVASSWLPPSLCHTGRECKQSGHFVRPSGIRLVGRERPHCGVELRISGVFLLVGVEK